MDYRPLPDAREDEFREMVSYAFSPEEGPFDPEEADEVPPPARLGDKRGIFDADDELLAVCRHYWFDAPLRGRTVDVGGLSAVASPPENRRRGIVRFLLAESLREYRENDVAFGALWPFKHPFYERMGWGVANRYAVHELDPEQLAPTRAHSSGRIRKATPDDWKALQGVRDAHGADYHLDFVQDEEWWANRVFHNWDTDPYVYAWEDDDGEMRGYVVYVIDDDGRVLRSTDLAYADPEARLNLLRFLADHDSQVSTVTLATPIEDDLVGFVADDGEVETTVSAGAMFRVVDVVAGLPRLDYPTDIDASVTLRVADDLADWNDDTFRLDVADGKATVERVDGPVDATVSISGLSQLVVGFRTTDELRVRDELTAKNEDATERLDTVFPTHPTMVREGF